MSYGPVPPAERHRYRCLTCFQGAADTRDQETFKCHSCDGTMYKEKDVVLVHVKRPDLWPTALHIAISEQAQDMAKSIVSMPTQDRLAAWMRHFGYATPQQCDEMAEFIISQITHG